MSTENAQQPNSNPSAGSAKLPVMPRCFSCRFWRDKGWDGDEGIGKCGNPIVIEQVSMMSEELIERFVAGDTDKDKKSNARFLANSLRFHSHFGCVHYNGA